MVTLAMVITLCTIAAASAAAYTAVLLVQDEVRACRMLGVRWNRHLAVFAFMVLISLMAALGGLLDLFVVWRR